MRKRLIVWLSERDLKSDLIGGKAFNLAKLKRAGFNVPAFFIITTKADGKMSGQLKKQIFQNLKKLKTPNFAVRSSATCEDKNLASFAGQFESYLGVGKKDLIKAVRKCWDSVKKDRVLIYCASKKIDPKQIKMAVVVQEMIFAEKGGVIFTEDIFRQKKIFWSLRRLRD